METAKQNSHAFGYAMKNVRLAQDFTKISYYQYIECLFGADADAIPYVIADGKAKMGTAEADRILDLGRVRSNMYIRPVSFFNGYQNKKLMHKLYSFVVDIDHVNGASLEKIINRIKRQSVQPTMIVNSGGGIHLYYVLTEPVVCYYNRHKLLKKVLDGIRRKFDLDKAEAVMDEIPTIMQAYRFPGSLTKYGEVVAGFSCSLPVDFGKLCDWAGVDYRHYQEQERQKALQKKASKASQGNLVYFPSARKGVYSSTLKLVREKTQEGHRYMSMCALVVLAVKTHTPREQVEKDLNDLVKYWNGEKCRQKVSPREVGYAMTMYHNRFMRVRRCTLERYMGFEFTPVKRNGRTQKEHLEKVHTDRRQNTMEQVRSYLQAHPQASNAEIERETGITRKTVRKYRNLLEVSPP